MQTNQIFINKILQGKRGSKCSTDFQGACIKHLTDIPFRAFSCVKMTLLFVKFFNNQVNLYNLHSPVPETCVGTCIHSHIRNDVMRKQLMCLAHQGTNMGSLGTRIFVISMFADKSYLCVDGKLHPYYILYVDETAYKYLQS